VTDVLTVLVARIASVLIIVRIARTVHGVVVVLPVLIYPFVGIAQAVRIVQIVRIVTTLTIVETVLAVHIVTVAAIVSIVMDVSVVTRLWNVPAAPIAMIVMD
jgi:hypothetical protein